MYHNYIELYGLIDSITKTIGPKSAASLHLYINNYNLYVIIIALIIYVINFWFRRTDRNIDICTIRYKTLRK